MTIKCQKCGTVCDAKLSKTIYIDEFNKQYKLYQCPTCGAKILIKTKSKK